MTREEFRANLYQTYVSSSVCDPVLIQEYIRIAESFVFDSHEITAFDLQKINQATIEDAHQSNGSYALCKHSGDHVDELIKEQRADAKIALRVIQQYQFATLLELVHQITLVAYGEVNTTGSLSK